MLRKQTTNQLPALLMVIIAGFTSLARAGESSLKTFNDPSAAIETRYPSTMILDTGSSCEGRAFVFKFGDSKNDESASELRIFLPGGAKTTADAERIETSVIKSNGWKIVSTDTKKCPYPWVKKVISFKTETKEKGKTTNNVVQGKALMGETNHQAVCVTYSYRSDNAEKMMSAAKTILSNLKFKANQLPIPEGD